MTKNEIANKINCKADLARIIKALSRLEIFMIIVEKQKAGWAQTVQKTFTQNLKIL